jgi:ABC-2 type transport system ATP-binding protein
VADLAALIARLPGGRDVVIDRATVTGRVADGPRALPELVRAADRADLVVTSAQVFRPTLDDVFLSLTGRSLREAENGRSTDETRSPAA